MSFTLPRLTLIFLFPIAVTAQTTTVIPNTAESDVVQPDTLREDLVPLSGNGGGAVIFAPAKKQRTIRAVEINEKLKIDGRLDEADWQRVAPIHQFIQVDPKQGTPATFDTDVRVLYNRQFLYIAAFNRDSAGRRALRTPNFKRDFSPQANDLFGVAVDGFHDKRNAMAFLTNPYATQRDLLSFDDLLYDTDWDGLWKVRTTRTDSGWIAEMQIPWQTLRYPRTADSVQTWGINFFRNRRSSNELSAWSPFPRAFPSALRMEYAGLITGIKPPPPRANIRVQPYVLIADDRYNGTEVGTSGDAKLKIGGDLKWAINPNTVLDLTLNTDFAQADVDRQVNNLKRLSVLFPERRGFFLENASLFGAGLAGNDFGEGGSMVIQPFFSRTIGLAQLPDGTSSPVPIDAGARIVYRSVARNYGGMFIRQRGIPGSPTTDFAVGRYVENVGKQNRIGGIVTFKNVHATDSTAGRQNATVAVDGFFRISQSLSYNAMVIGSFTNDANEPRAQSNANGQGLSGYSQFFYRSNQFVGWLTQTLVTRNFNPEMGFVSRSDVFSHSFGGFLVNRPKWIPKWVRNFEPGAFIELYHKASTGYLQEAQWNLNPVWFTFQNAGNFGLFVNPVFQRLDDGDYRPLDLAIRSGTFRYVRYAAILGTDPSKRVSFNTFLETGRYYDGQLHYGRASMILAPIPHTSFTLSSELNRFQNVGSYTGTVALYSVEGRLAMNPRVQLIGFFQRNTYTDKNVWNMRLSWEFQPLSFLYIVYNHGSYAGSLRITDRQQEQHIIGKVSYLKQF
ncbi:carbohydrate binding family 9 domain-containing protein [Spirosoma fluminis]